MARPNRLSRILLTTAMSLILFGCSGDSEPLSTDEQIEALDKDLDAMFGSQQKLAAPLTQGEAMARGIMYNMNNRVAAMNSMIASGQVNEELLGALPALNGELATNHRDDPEYRNARDENTNTQTLPPSKFGDEDHQTAGIEASWDVLDAGMSIAQARQASNRARMSDEVRRKVVHDIVQDVRSTYWRAASAQILAPRIADALQRNRETVAALDDLAGHKSTTDSKLLLQQQSRLLESANDLMNLQAQMNTAKAELAALINLPPGQDFTLAVTEADILSLPETERVVADPMDLEIVALMVRPEVRKDLLASRVSATDTRLTALRAFPGLETAFGYNYDSDSFLSDTNWTNFSVSLAGNLMKLFTLPVQFEQSKNRERLVNMQRQAVVVSVLTQVNLARQRLDMAEDRLSLLRKLMHVEQQLVPVDALPEAESQRVMAQAASLEQEQTALNARGRFHMAYADYQNAYGRLLNSVGIDPLPPVYESNNIPAMAATIESRTEALTPRIFGRVVAAVKQQRPQGLAVTENGTEQGGIIPASAPGNTTISAIAPSRNNPAIGEPLVITSAAPSRAQTRAYNE